LKQFELQLVQNRAHIVPAKFLIFAEDGSEQPSPKEL